MANHHEETQFITVKCPECKHEFDQKVEIVANNDLNIEIESY